MALPPPATQVLQDGLQGTQMSLLNTLTRRCIMDGSKLLFVPDVMTALRTYGEVRLARQAPCGRA